MRDPCKVFIDIFTFSHLCTLSWALKFIFWLMFLPSYILDRASNISLSVSLEDTWGIKWSLIESAMILLAIIMSFLYFYFASSSSGFGTTPLIKFSRSFSYRMIPILYFKERKFSIHSNLSFSLVLGDILSLRTENGKN